MQFLLIAYDGTDAEAPARRLQNRPAHLARAKEMKQSGHCLLGGAILNDAGDMIGSTMVMQFDTPEEFDAWLGDDPYTKGGVWKTVEVKPFRCAPM
jgi:uncharacterized protein